jgi:hypothetical protein
MSAEEEQLMRGGTAVLSSDSPLAESVIPSPNRLWLSWQALMPSSPSVCLFFHSFFSVGLIPGILKQGERMLTTPTSGWDEDHAMLSRWGLKGMGSFQSATVVAKESKEAMKETEERRAKAGDAVSV